MTEVEAEVDVEASLECGACYHWWRVKRDGVHWYEVGFDDGFLRVRDTDHGFEYEARDVPASRVERFLGLDDDLDEIRRALAGDPEATEAFDRHRGLRVLRDDFLPCLVGFVASQRSRNERTLEVVREIATNWGGSHGDWRAHRFPGSGVLAEATEERLRDAGLGYRAPYVKGCAEAVDAGVVDPRELRRMEYEEARDELQRLPGVGPKVADCVCLFSLEFLDVVALDTWMRDVVSTLYPSVDADGYDETSRGFRRLFDGYAGYAQTVLYHDVRTSET